MRCGDIHDNGGIVFFSWNKDRIPTIDLYFGIPLVDVIGKRGWRRHHGPLRQLGPYVFMGNGRAVILRYATRRELLLLERLAPERCAYVIDDDLFSLDHAAELPEDYRRRLLRFREEVLPDILARVDTICAPSERILRAYRGKRLVQLLPSAVHVCDDHAHFLPNKAEGKAGINLVFAGTRSHLPDLVMYETVLCRILDTLPHARLTLFLGRHTPEKLKKHAQVIVCSPKRWPQYAQMLKRARFHVHLVFNQATAFNSARSQNKVLETAAFGAAGIYTRTPPFSSVIENGENGVMIPVNADAAEKYLMEVLSDRERLQRLAMKGADLARRLDGRAKARRFWLEFFGIAETDMKGSG